MRRLPSPAELLVIANFECLARPEAWERLAGAFRYRGEYSEDRRRVWSFLLGEGLSLNETADLTGAPNHSSVGMSVGRGTTRLPRLTLLCEPRMDVKAEPVLRPATRAQRTAARDAEWSRAVRIYVDNLSSARS